MNNIKLKTFIQLPGTAECNNTTTHIEVSHPRYLYRYNNRIKNSKARFRKHVESMVSEIQKMIGTLHESQYIMDHIIEIEELLYKITELITPYVYQSVVDEIKSTILYLYNDKINLDINPKNLSLFHNTIQEPAPQSLINIEKLSSDIVEIFNNYKDQHDLCLKKILDILGTFRYYTNGTTPTPLVLKIEVSDDA